MEGSKDTELAEKLRGAFGSNARSQQPVRASKKKKGFASQEKRRKKKKGVASVRKNCRPGKCPEETLHQERSKIMLQLSGGGSKTRRKKTKGLLGVGVPSLKNCRIGRRRRHAMIKKSNLGFWGGLPALEKTGRTGRPARMLRKQPN